MSDLFDARVLAFERAWQSGAEPPIADFLQKVPPVDESECQGLLQELICIDLEYRWRRSGTVEGSAKVLTLDDYAREFAAWKSLDELPLELIAEEYRVRQRWGDRPGHATFLARFRTRLDELQAMLTTIDAELRCEAEPLFGSAGTFPLGPALSCDGTVDPRAPLPFGDFLLQCMIGVGRMGKVYQARRHSTGDDVAVKFLRKSFHRHAELVERFVREAQLLAQLGHPHLIGVHGLGRTRAGGYFISMELIEGGDLAHVVTTGGPVAWKDAARWTHQAADAIEHAHAQGIVHCDLKPGNLLLDRNGNIHVTDFGLARSLHGGEANEDAIEGTAPFMAPEQVSRHWGDVGPHTDIYGLGAVLYTLLTGQPPWPGRTTADVLAQILSGAAIMPPKSVRADLPDAICEVCLRCLAKNPSDRFATAGELRDALRTT